MFNAIQKKKISLNHTLTLLYSLLFAYFFCYHTYLSWEYIVDDAFITLRYADHLVHHHGLVWNIGESHIEGYSNFLYVLFGAVAIYFKLSPIVVLKSLSVMAMAISILGLYKLSSLWLPKKYCLLSGLLLTLHPGEIIWGVSGLETAFYQALFIFSTYYVLKGMASPRSSSSKQHCLYIAISGLLMAFLGLTRPEAPMLFLCYTLLIAWMDSSIISQRVLIFVSTFSLVYAPYFIWRLFYFGKLFPNTVYCKAMRAPSGAWELDISYLILIFPLFVFIIPYLKKSYEQRHLFLLLPSLCYLIVLYNADWIVGYLDRHFLAALSLLIPLYILGVQHLFSWKAIRLNTRFRTVLVVLFSVISGYLFLGGHYTNAEFSQTAKNTKKGRELSHNVAHWLNTHLKKTDTVSLGDCGLIPYLYQGKFIDSYCLNSLEMTQAPILYSYPRFTEWLLHTKKPEYIILLALLTPKKAYYAPADYILLKSKTFHKHYEKIKRFMLGTEKAGYQYVLYRNRAHARA